MAYVVTNRRSGISLADLVANIAVNVKAALARRAIYSRTLAELNALSDRDLSDLGVSRHQIADLAREAAYGK
ncbi:MAG: DUF1127 domain-containing protein [Gemmobacter sp.]|uniref:DUF1127 domain-containing protein n=1 Tax=Gemmobacter sp. TaxID=1898957 RepID=UPI001A3F5241|nr:DUF1127 domain-containing protein [Gemmobacter sp.]MBL8561662.1 DUF1127 domain-containing protein [Gemmobacter sp.]